MFRAWRLFDTASMRKPYTQTSWLCKLTPTAVHALKQSSRSPVLWSYLSLQVRSTKHKIDVSSSVRRCALYEIYVSSSFTKALTSCTALS